MGLPQSVRRNGPR